MRYFDHAATTPPYKDVIRTVHEVMERHYGNPSSLHQFGEESSKLLRKAREVCAKALRVNADEVVFTSGATESNNLAIKGAALQYEQRGKHIVTTSIEHPSVYDTCKQLEKQGWEITYLPVDSGGVVSVDSVISAIRKDTVLVSVMHVNNETGAVQPIEEIGKAIKARDRRILFHVDGVQGFGVLELSLKPSGVDLFSLSAHKIRGPKGIGLLYIRDGITLQPLLAGGGQEDGVRSGTENLPYIVAFAKAMRLAQEGRNERAVRMNALKELLISEISKMPELILNSSQQSAAHIIHFSYPGMKAEAMLHMLEEAGFLVSTRSACSSKSTEPSRVLLAMGRSKAAAASGIRVSLGEEHTREDIYELLEAISSSIERMRPIIQGGTP